MSARPVGSTESREIKRKTRRKFSAEEKIRIVLEGLRGEETIAELCRRQVIQRGYSVREVAFSAIGLLPMASGGDQQWSRCRCRDIRAETSG